MFKFRYLTIFLLIFFLVFSLAYAEFYKVNITRIDQDLYKDTWSGIYIETRFCFEHVYYQDAILKYEPFRYDNKLIFKNGRAYDVVRIFK